MWERKVVPELCYGHTFCIIFSSRVVYKTSWCRDGYSMIQIFYVYCTVTGVTQNLKFTLLVLYIWITLRIVSYSQDWMTTTIIPTTTTITTKFFGVYRSGLEEDVFEPLPRRKTTELWKDRSKLSMSVTTGRENSDYVINLLWRYNLVVSVLFLQVPNEYRSGNV